MHKPPKKMDAVNMVRASEDAKRRVKGWIEQAEKANNDPGKTDRLKKQECIACYYSSRVGGQAITEQDCMCCGETQTYSSTATDVLCMDCARAHDLCKRCGGDIKMRSRRKQGWPKVLHA